jgi:amidase
MDINGRPLEVASIAQIRAAQVAGRVTARELVEAYLARIAAYDQAGPALNTIVTLNPQALDRADELDAALAAEGLPVGPLHGIPVVVKDCLDTADMPTSYGSEVFADYRPGEDATVVTRLRDAGAIILAKTTLPDFASSFLGYSSRSGETKNPYDLERDPGGSSSGTGAAISSAFAAIGLGTDTGGSVRLPSSWCNLVGVRSTPGLISRKGCSPLLGFQDTIGPMGRSVEDVARVFDVLVGFDPDDEMTYAYSVARAPESYLDSLVPDGLSGLSIGVLRSAFGSDDDPDCKPVNDVMASALGELVAGGAELVDVVLPGLDEHLASSALYVERCLYDINSWLASKKESPVGSVQEIVDSKRYHHKMDLLEAIAGGPEDPFQHPGFHAGYLARDSFMKSLVNLMESRGLTVLVYPTCQVVAPTRAEADSDKWNTLNFPTNTLIGSQSWLPAMTVPAGFTTGGVPVGMEILARPYDEPSLFRVGYGYERSSGHRRHPDSVPFLS